MRPTPAYSRPRKTPATAQRGRGLKPSRPPSLRQVQRPSVAIRGGVLEPEALEGVRKQTRHRPPAPPGQRRGPVRATSSFYENGKCPTRISGDKYCRGPLPTSTTTAKKTAARQSRLLSASTSRTRSQQDETRRIPQPQSRASFKAAHSFVAGQFGVRDHDAHKWSRHSPLSCSTESDAAKTPKSRANSTGHFHVISGNPGRV